MATLHNKKIIIVLRMLFFLAGAIIGYVTMWQILQYFTIPVAEQWFVVFQVSAALFLGVVLAISTKAIMAGGIAVGSVLKRIFTVVRPVKIAGSIIGIIIGGMAVYLVDTLLSLFLPILAVRIVIDIAVGLVCSFLGAIACIKWLEGSEVEVPVYDGGFIISPSALEDDKILPLLSDWLIGDKVILLASVNELIGAREEEEGKRSLINYEKLIAAKVLRVADGEKSGAEGIANYSILHRMKIIAKTKDEFLNVNEEILCNLNVLALDDIK